MIANLKVKESYRGSYLKGMSGRVIDRANFGTVALMTRMSDRGCDASETVSIPRAQGIQPLVGMGKISIGDVIKVC